jgi:hypothetical protein
MTLDQLAMPRQQGGRGDHLAETSEYVLPVAMYPAHNAPPVDPGSVEVEAPIGPGCLLDGGRRTGAEGWVAAIAAAAVPDTAARASPTTRTVRRGSFIREILYLEGSPCAAVNSGLSPSILGG